MRGGRGSLFYFDTGCGVGLSVAEDIDLSIAEDFADSGIAIGGYIRDLNICGSIRYILIARIRYITAVLKGGAKVRIIFDITK